MDGRWRFVGLLWLFSLWGWVQPVRGADNLEGKNVGQIELESDGPLTMVAPSDLRGLIELRSGDRFSQSAVRHSIQRLFSTRVFHDILVSAEPDGEVVNVTFTLIRKYLVSELDFTGSTALSKEDLRRAVTIRPGEPYSEDALARSLAKLMDLYRRNGYYKSALTPEFELDQEKALLKVVFRIDSGPRAVVGEFSLEVQGNELDREEVAKWFSLQRRKEFSQSDLTEEMRMVSERLVRRGYLDALVYVREGPDYEPESNQVRLTVRVVPRRKTPIDFVGADLSDEELQDLPLFSERSPAGIFQQETVEALQTKYQSEGYLMAAVRLEDPQADPNRIVFRIDRGDKLKVGQILFSGNRFATSTELRVLVSVKPSGFFSRGMLTDQILEQDQRNLESFYQQRGFLDAKVTRTLERREGKVDVTFQIVEGDRYRVSAFTLTGVEKIDEKMVRKEIRIEANQPFAPLVVAQDRANVIALYENLGYRQVDFRSEIKRTSEHSVEVKYLIREGSQSLVDRIVVTGNSQTRRRVILREVALQSGAPLSLGGVLETEANLYNLAVFNRVQINEEPSHKDPNSKTVIVNVEEAKKYTLLYGIGYSSFEGPRGTVGFTNNNFLGRARTVSLGTRLGRTRQRGNLSYTLPRLLGRKLPTVFSFTIDNEKAQTTRTFGSQRAILGRPFDSFRLIGSMQTERRLSRRESLFFRYRYEDVHLDVPADLEVPLEFFREEENLRLSSLSVSYLNESRDDPSEPTKGFFVSGDASATSRFIGSEAELLRFFGQGQYYKEVRPGLVWASSLRLGVIAPYARTDRVPISERFFSGGANTLRGLPQDLAGPLLRDSETGEVILVNEDGERDPNGRPLPLGGRALLIFNTELRFPIVGFVKGAAFYDIGNVYERIHDIFLTAPTHTLGLGLLLSTPVGPIRFDVGYNPDPPGLPGFRHFNFNFTLGHPF